MKSKIHGLYALCDTTFSPQKNHAKLAHELLSAGVSILQLRMKDEKDLQKVQKTAEEILKFKDTFSFTFILNDFVEIAAQLPCDGVHIGQDDLSLSQTRQIVGNEKLIGYSSHSFEEALEAEKQGADYVALGAIFPTKTKGPGHPVVGLETLKKVVTQLKKPVVAIGGINPSNFESVAATGVSAIAMISALTEAKDLPQQVQWFLEKFNQA